MADDLPVLEFIDALAKIVDRAVWRLREVILGRLAKLTIVVVIDLHDGHRHAGHLFRLREHRLFDREARSSRLSPGRSPRQ